MPCDVGEEVFGIHYSVLGFMVMGLGLSFRF
jgi:hypothetical protein